MRLGGGRDDDVCCCGWGGVAREHGHLETKERQREGEIRIRTLTAFLVFHSFIHSGEMPFGLW